MANSISRTGTSAAPVSFGIFDWIDRSDIGWVEVYEQRLKMIEHADQAGFYCYHLAEHQATPLGGAPSPGIFLAAASQRTRRIQLGPLVYLLPIYNPLRLAQEICMLDNLSRGRLQLGVGRGVSPLELGFYQVDTDTSREMFREALDIITAGLSTGEVSYQGKHYSFDHVRLHLRPVQRPYPPLWYPTDNPDSIRWLAQEGFNTITHYPPMEKMRELFDLYRAVWDEHRGNAQRLNGHVASPKYGIVRHVYVAETDTQAMREAKEAFAHFIDNFNFLRNQVGPHPRSQWLADFEARIEDGLHVVGSAASVREQVRQHVETTGTNYFVGSFAFGSLTTEQVLRSMNLFATEVMPAFRSEE